MSATQKTTVRITYLTTDATGRRLYLVTFEHEGHSPVTYAKEIDASMFDLIRILARCGNVEVVMPEDADIEKTTPEKRT